MAYEHELRLKIDATAAKRGSQEFVGAVNAIKAAVKNLERDTDGAFTKLRSGRVELDTRSLARASAEASKLGTTMAAAGSASDKAVQQIIRTSLSAAQALRTSENAAQRLNLRMQEVGDLQGIATLEAALSRLRGSLVAAQTPLDVRQAYSGYRDLHDSLNRATVAAVEHRWAMKQATQADAEAGAATAVAAARIEALALKYNPLKVQSLAYARALDEVAEAERAGALSAGLAEQARAAAANQYLAGAAAANQYSGALKNNAAMTQQGIMAGMQLQDILIVSQMGFQSVATISLQQGSQLAGQLNTIRASGGSVFKTLVGGFTSLINPLSLVVIGGTAVIAMLAKWAFSAAEAEDRAKTFRDALDEVSAATQRFATAAQAANAPAREIIENYGSASATIREFLAAVAEGERLKMLGEVTTTISALKDEFLELREYATGNFLEAPQQMLTFKDTAVAAGDATGKLRLALVALSTAQGPKAQYEAALALKRALDEAAAANGGLNAEQRILYDRVVAVGSELGRVIGETDAATAATNGWANAMGGVRAEINAILSALSALSGSVISNAAKRAESTALAAGASVRDAEVARLRYQHDAEMRAREMGAGAGVSGWINRRIIAAERFQFDEGIRLDNQLTSDRAAARKREATTGGGRKGAGKGEAAEAAKAYEKLAESIQKETNSLLDENEALMLVATGRADNIETAKLMAEAARLTGGAVDETTMALIRQREEAEKLNKQLKILAADPLKDWLDGIPGWIEAGQKIEVEVFQSLSDTISEFIKTGKFDLESLGESILGIFADIVADKATKELLNLFNMGGGDGKKAGFNLGGVLGNLFGSTGDEAMPDLGAAGTQEAMISGSMTAGSNIGNAMVTAGSQVAGQIQAALTAGGAQAGATVRGGLTTGGAMAGAQVQSGASSGGAILGQGVVQGANAGAPILAQGVASGAAGGRMGGGGGGGLMGLMGMILPGIFHDGGAVTSGSAGVQPYPASLWHDAPRYHSGGPVLASGEVPAILQEGEHVLSRKEVRNLASAQGGDDGEAPRRGGNSQVINMVVNTPDVESFRRSQKQIAAEAGRASRRAMRDND